VYSGLSLRYTPLTSFPPPVFDCLQYAAIKKLEVGGVWVQGLVTPEVVCTHSTEMPLISSLTALAPSQPLHSCTNVTHCTHSERWEGWSLRTSCLAIQLSVCSASLMNSCNSIHWSNWALRSAHSVRSDAFSFTRDCSCEGERMCQGAKVGVSRVYLSLHVHVCRLKCWPMTPPSPWPLQKHSVQQKWGSVQIERWPWNCPPVHQSHPVCVCVCVSVKWGLVLACHCNGTQQSWLKCLLT